MVTNRLFITPSSPRVPRRSRRKFATMLPHDFETPCASDTNSVQTSPSTGPISRIFVQGAINELNTLGNGTPKV